MLQAVHGELEALVEGSVGAARHELVGADLAQQLLEDVDHRQPKGDADGRRQAQLETRMHVVRVYLVVGDDGDLRVAGVVERLAQ